MGHLNSRNLHEPKSPGEYSVPERRETKGRGWLWIVALAVVVAAGFWYFRDSKASTEAQSQTAPGAPSTG
jgi:hypothetical protein